MNIHHLELFYYVARHGGVSAAARRIPYGIQQPAISAQVLQLEDNLGTELFARRPFRLTPAGEELYAFIEPFFGKLDEVAGRLRGGAEVSIRIGAMETVHRAYLPRLLRALQGRLPELRFTLVPARTEDLEDRVVAQEIDIGVGPLLGPRREGIKREELLRVPMALLVPRASRIHSAEELWQSDRIAAPLVSGAAEGSVHRLFQAELRRRQVEWFPRIELGSQELIAHYVADGFGLGLVLVEPGAAVPKGLRLLPLHDFPAIPYGLVWSGRLTPLRRAFIAEAHALAQSFAADFGAPLRRVSARGAARTKK